MLTPSVRLTILIRPAFLASPYASCRVVGRAGVEEEALSAWRRWQRWRCARCRGSSCRGWAGQEGEGARANAAPAWPSAPMDMSSPCTQKSQSIESRKARVAWYGVSKMSSSTHLTAATKPIRSESCMTGGPLFLRISASLCTPTTSTPPTSLAISRAWRTAFMWPECIMSKQPSTYTRGTRPGAPNGTSFPAALSSANSCCTSGSRRHGRRSVCEPASGPLILSRLPAGSSRSSYAARSLASLYASVAVTSSRCVRSRRTSASSAASCCSAAMELLRGQIYVGQP